MTNATNTIQFNYTLNLLSNIGSNGQQIRNTLCNYLLRTRNVAYTAKVWMAVSIDQGISATKWLNALSRMAAKSTSDSIKLTTDRAVAAASSAEGDNIEWAAMNAMWAAENAIQVVGEDMVADLLFYMIEQTSL